MKRIALIAVLLMLSGCGVSETAVTAAAVGAAKEKEIEAGKQTEDKVKQQLDAASMQEQQRLKDAESGAK
jgi:hypothetical protein